MEYYVVWVAHKKTIHYSYCVGETAHVDKETIEHFRQQISKEHDVLVENITIVYWKYVGLKDA